MDRIPNDNVSFVSGGKLDKLNDYDRPFPQRIITPEIAMNDYEKLRAYPVKTQPFGIIGNRALDIFMFLKRKSTPLSRMSHKEAWENLDERKKMIAGCVVIESRRKARKHQITRKEQLTEGLLVDCMNMRYGSVSQFRPLVAKYLYAKFKATKVLDFTAGWGGRLLGAMSLDIDYIGIDTNIDLKTEYEKIIKTYPSNSNVKMIWKKAETVDYSKLDYDFVFTSPPYINLEKYANMPKYDESDFFEIFLYPTIKNSFRYLPKDKWYCLNIPIDMYKRLIKDKVLIKETLRIPLNKYHRNGSGNNYNEFIYCWKKR
tara:strand:+ start:2167 stop:3111 length:945 start_codon:yes stop_codon:yes gene_type:complete